jgi:DNA repair protein RadC
MNIQEGQCWRICYEPVLKAWDSNGIVKEVTIKPRVGGPVDIYTLLNWMTILEQEVFVGVYMDMQGGVLGYEIIHIGSVDSSVVSIQDVLKPALLYSAPRMIVAHNHPSGDSTPSAEDLQATRMISEACNLFNITLDDHVIMARDGNYSFKEHHVVD